MQVVEVSCPDCGDEWTVPSADRDGIRDTCRDCGASLTTELMEV